VNQEALAHWGLLRQKQTNKQNMRVYQCHAWKMTEVAVTVLDDSLCFSIPAVNNNNIY